MRQGDNGPFIRKRIQRKLCYTYNMRKYVESIVRLVTHEAMSPNAGDKHS